MCRGDTRGLRQLYDTYADELYTLAARLTGCQADAEDVVHDVFGSLHETIGSFRGHGSLAGWLRTVVVRRALMLLRKRRRKRETSLAKVRDPLVTSPNVLDHILLEKALSRLPDNLRAVVVLKEIEGYSHREIARQFGIAEGTSAKWLCKAKAMLRKEMVL